MLASFFSFASLARNLAPVGLKMFRSNNDRIHTQLHRVNVNDKVMKLLCRKVLS